MNEFGVAAKQTSLFFIPQCITWKMAQINQHTLRVMRIWTCDTRCGKGEPLPRGESARGVTTQALSRGIHNRMGNLLRTKKLIFFFFPLHCTLSFRILFYCHFFFVCFFSTNKNFYGSENTALVYSLKSFTALNLEPLKGYAVLSSCCMYFKPVLQF